MEINKQLILEAYQMAMTSKNANNNVVDNSNSSGNTAAGVIGSMLVAPNLLPVTLPLSYYGRQQDPYRLVNKSNIPNHENYNQNADKQAIKENTDLVQEDGAWDKSMRARNNLYNNMDNQYSQNFKNNPGHYLFNPAVAGPLSHSALKGIKSIENGLYRMFKDNDSPDMNKDVTVAADTRDNPFNSNVDVLRASYNNYTDDIRQIRKDHPGNFYANPFVAGPINSAMGHVGGAVSKGLRTITSPTSKAGDTLVHNTGRRLG